MDELEVHARSMKGYQGVNGLKCPECSFVGKNRLALNGHKHIHSHVKKPEYQKISMTMKDFTEVMSEIIKRYIKNLMENKAYLVFWLNGDGKTLSCRAVDDPAKYIW
jgi:Trk K+ transport system NAD-binding subunit